MGIGAGLQAAVNGFVGGRDVRNRWEDRKTDGIRQKRMDELRENAEVRAQQAHEMDLETDGLMNTARRQSIRQNDLDWSDDQSLRGAMSAADQAAMDGMAGLGAVREAPVPDLSADLNPAVVSTSGRSSLGDQLAAAQRAATAPALGAVRSSEHQGAAPEGPAVAPPSDRPGSYAPPTISSPAMVGGAGVDVRSDPAPMAESEAEIVRAATAPARAVARGPANMPPLGAVPLKADFLRLNPDGKLIANREPRTPEEKQMLIEAAKSGKLGSSRARAEQQRGIDAQAALDLPYSWGEDGNAVADLDRVGRLGKRASEDALRAAGGVAAEAGEIIANQAVNTVQGVNAPLQAASRYLTGEDHIGAPARVDVNGDGKRASMATPLAESWGSIRANDSKKPVPAPAHAPASAGDAAPETAKAVSDSAARVMDAVTESPSMKAATEAIPAAALGVSKTTPMTKPQRDKAAKTYMQSYRENGAPMVIRTLMKQGKLEQAQKFEAWVKDSRAEEGMTSWGRGIFAAMQGDADGAADAFMDAYNSSGYFDDGMEVVKEKSRIIRDDAGEVVGVSMTMRSLETGEEFTQTDSVDGFIQKAAWITSPEKAFEASSARLAAQQEALLKAEEERRASATKLVEANYTKTVDLARDMFARSQAEAKDARESAMLTGEAADVPGPLTWDEAFREAQRIMTDGPAAVTEQAGPPIIARRPQ